MSSQVGQPEESWSPIGTALPPDLTFTSHVRERWLHRAPDPYYGTKDVDTGLEQVWAETVAIAACHINRDELQARIHPPTALEFLHSSSTIVTTFNIRETGIYTEHLERCEDCGLLYDPRRSDEDECFWCERGIEPARSTRRASRDTGRRSRYSPKGLPTPSPAEDPPEPLETHPCPGCGRKTAGCGRSQHCKVCLMGSNGQDTDQQPTEPERCAEEGCFREPAASSDRCEFCDALAREEAAR